MPGRLHYGRGGRRIEKLYDFERYYALPLVVSWLFVFWLCFSFWGGGRAHLPWPKLQNKQEVVQWTLDPVFGRTYLSRKRGQWSLLGNCTCNQHWAYWVDMFLHSDKGRWHNHWFRWLWCRKRKKKKRCCRTESHDLIFTIDGIMIIKIMQDWILHWSHKVPVQPA